MNDVPTSFGKYQVIKTLGRGSYGVVVYARQVFSKKDFACKIIDRKQLEEVDRMYSFEQEIRIHQFLNHKSIVKIEEIMYLEKYIIVIMEYCINGDLHDLIFGDRYEQLLYNMRKIIYQLSEAISYLHSRGIYHLDIKPENILLDADYNCKLCDFGCCSTERYQAQSIYSGTVAFLAPEIVLNQPCYADKCDIWAFGITLYVMLTRCVPWKGCNDFETIKDEIVNSSLDLEILRFYDYKDILSHCLNKNPALRPTIDEILKTNTFTSYLKKGSKSIKMQKPIRFSSNDMPYTAIAIQQIFGARKVHASLVMNNI